jgi:hypothetical protein
LRTSASARCELSSEVHPPARWVADDGADLARDGDSGSVLIDEEGRLVAILVAADDWLEGEPAGAVAVPAWLTFDRLGIDLPDEEVVTAEYRSAFGELR